MKLNFPICIIGIIMLYRLVVNSKIVIVCNFHTALHLHVADIHDCFSFYDFNLKGVKLIIDT